VALLVVGLASADSRPGVTALHNKIRTLRKEETATIKAIQARYRAIKRRDRLTERELKFERAEIKRQEDVALALAASPTEREQIRTAYDALRRYLTKAVKLEEHEIKLLTDEEHAHIHQIKALYRAQIRQLEQEVHKLERSSGKKR